jgi:ATP:corrinoid adenosyltransferase
VKKEVKLFVKLGYESDFKKANRKKFVSLSRTEQADYPIAKLSWKETVAALVAEELQAAPPVVIAEVLPAVTIAFQSWEEVNEYFHSKYGFSKVNKKESVPTSSDIYNLYVYY